METDHVVTIPMFNANGQQPNPTDRKDMSLTTLVVQVILFMSRKRDDHRTVRRGDRCGIVPLEIIRFLVSHGCQQTIKIARFSNNDKTELISERDLPSNANSQPPNTDRLPPKMSSPPSRTRPKIQAVARTHRATKSSCTPRKEYRYR